MLQRVAACLQLHVVLCIASACAAQRSIQCCAPPAATAQNAATNNCCFSDKSAAVLSVLPAVWCRCCGVQRELVIAFFAYNAAQMVVSFHFFVDMVTDAGAGRWQLCTLSLQ
jgi:hypothetical protein